MPNLFSLGLVDGAVSCVRAFPTVLSSPRVWGLYVRFALRYAFILALSFGIISATYVGLGIFAIILLGGGMLAVPLLGLQVVMVGSAVGLAMIYYGIFPWSLVFSVGGGVLQPFFHVGSIAFFLTNIFAPIGSSNFFIVGLNIWYPDKARVVEKALERRGGGMGGVVYRLWNGLQMLMYDVCIR